MGLFDTFVDAEGHHWQTKALGRALAKLEIGAAVDGGDPIDAYQVDILGDADPVIGSYTRAFATVREGRLVSLPDERDRRLPLRSYQGPWTECGRPDGADDEITSRRDAVEVRLAGLVRKEHEVHYRTGSDFDARDAAIDELRYEARQLIAEVQRT